MRITRVIESEDGATELTVDLTPDQTKYVLGVGLNYLVRQGASLQLHKEKLIVPGTNTE